MSDRLFGMVRQAVTETSGKAGLSVRECLQIMGVKKSMYYKRQQSDAVQDEDRRRFHWNIDRLSEAERQAVISYALAHTEYRHRELAYRMIDEDVAYVSESSVYRILKGAALMSERKERKRRHQRRQGAWATTPDQRWQTDIMYLSVGNRDHYLLLFLDEYSRYIVSWRLLHFMDGKTVTEAAREVVSKSKPARTPEIQSDNGSAFISGDFKRMLQGRKIEHVTINVGSPSENALVERGIRTLREAVEEKEAEGYEETLRAIEQVVDYYNNKRYHSALEFLPPAVYYRGKPQEILSRRREKLAAAREKRRRRNLGLSQQPLFARAEKTGTEAVCLESCARDGLKEKRQGKTALPFPCGEGAGGMGRRSLARVQ